MVRYSTACKEEVGFDIELLKDYKALGRQRGYEIWTPARCRGEIREIRKIWEIIHATPTLPDNPNFPDLPNNPKVAMNMLITLVNQAQANYHIDGLIDSLNEKHRKEGGFTENLYKRRKEYRGY